MITLGADQLQAAPDLGGLFHPAYGPVLRSVLFSLGEIVTTRYTLRALLDRLDEPCAPSGGKPPGAGPCRPLTPD